MADEFSDPEDYETTDTTAVAAATAAASTSAAGGAGGTTATSAATIPLLALPGVFINLNPIQKDIERTQVDRPKEDFDMLQERLVPDFGAGSISLTNGGVFTNTRNNAVCYMGGEYQPMDLDDMVNRAVARQSYLTEQERYWINFMRPALCEPVSEMNISKLIGRTLAETLLPLERREGMRRLAYIRTNKSLAQCGANVIRTARVCPELNYDMLVLVLSWFVHTHSALADLSRFKAVNHRWYQVTWMIKLRSGALQLHKVDTLNILRFLTFPLGLARRSAIPPVRRHVTAVKQGFRRFLSGSSGGKDRRREVPKHAFAPLRYVKRLEIELCPMTDAMCNHLCQIAHKLTMLGLRDCDLNVRHLEIILKHTDMGTLRALSVANNYKTLTSLSGCHQYMTRLEALDCSACHHMSRDDLYQIGDTFTQLRFLDFSALMHLKGFTPKGLRSIEVLYMAQTPIIGRNTPEYTLDLDACASTLIALDLSCTSISADPGGGFLPELRRFTNLRSLHISSCLNLAQAGFNNIHRCFPPSLRYLNTSGILRNTDVTMVEVVVVMLQRAGACMINSAYVGTDLYFLQSNRFVLFWKAVPRLK